MRQSSIKAICDARGIRYSWLAAQVGVSVWMFNHIEAGRRNAPDGYHERAASVLGVPVDMIREPEPVAAPAPEWAAPF